MDRAFLREIQDHLDEFYPARIHLREAKLHDEDIGMLTILATRLKIHDIGHRIVHSHKTGQSTTEDLERFFRLTKLHRYQLKRRISLGHTTDPSNFAYLVTMTALFHRCFS